VEEPCIRDLSQFCTDRTGRGEEMECLQEHLEKLSPACRTQVSNYTEEEAEHIELNPFITAYCSRFLETHCKDELEDGDESEIMDCLIDYKMSDTQMNSKCRAAVEHFQVIAMQDFLFSAPFKRACKGDIARLCGNLKVKSQVVACLSETIRNDSLGSSNPLHRLEKQHRVSQSCRQQLRIQLFQQHEDVKFNPGVHQPCERDEKKFCSAVKAGQGRILECLKSNRKKLEASCHAAIFKVEKEEMADSSVDFPLRSTCKEQILRFCKNDMSQALDCLKLHLNNIPEVKCKTLVLERMAEQNLDIRFNPALRKACSADIPKFCLKIWEKAPEDHELEGQVVNCLKENYITKKRLSESCTVHLKEIVEQQALHFQLDPVLLDVCGKEIHLLCDNEVKENSDGQVEECLKTKFDQLISKDCKRHTALLISAAHIDIQADPLLHRACAIDLVTYCKDVPSGEGRRLRCLMRFKDRTATKLDPKCVEVLNSRRQLFAQAAKSLPLESLNDLVEQLSVSPSRNYFLLVGLCFVVVILITGVFCGRVTKRHRVLKNR